VTLFQQLEKLGLTLAVVGIVAGLVFTGRMDATSGMAYILGATGISVGGTLVGTKLGLTALTTPPTSPAPPVAPVAPVSPAPGIRVPEPPA